jgi:hypothetical protein
MAGTGGSPLLRSPSPVMNTMPTPPSAAVFDVEAASGARRLGIKPAADAGAAFVLESKGHLINLATT